MGAAGRSRVFWLLVILCAGVVGASAGVMATPSATSPPDDGVSLQEEEEIEADFFRMEVELTESGDSEWTVLFQQILDDDAEIEGFEELQEDIDTEPEQFVDPFEARMAAMVADASELTEREMELGEVSVRTERVAQPQGEVGNVIFEFEWRGFAATDGETVTAGDALSGLPLETNEVLEFQWSGEYKLDSHTPAAETVEDGHVVWRGPITFGDEEPRLSLVPAETESSEADNATDEPNGDDGSDESGSTTLLTAGTALVVGIVLLGAGVVALRRRGADEPAEDHGGDGSEGDETPTELLSPEERVLRLLRENDGRMKQKTVTERTGWSDSRTSQVVGELRDAGDVESFRIGRENVLTLPEVDIEAADEGADGDESDEKN